MVRKTVKLMGPGASFSMSSISSCLTFKRPEKHGIYGETEVAINAHFFKLIYYLLKIVQ